MSTSQLLTLVVTGIYVGVAISHGLAGRDGLGITFFGYAFANIGLIWAEAQQ